MKMLAGLLLLCFLTVGMCACSPSCSTCPHGFNCGYVECGVCAPGGLCVCPVPPTPGCCVHWGLSKDQYWNKAMWMEPALPPEGPDP